METIPRITLEAHDELIKDAVPLKIFRNKTYVLLKQSLVIKYFYHRGLWSTSTFRPYWMRFLKNTHKLDKLNITAPKVEKIFSLPEKSCHILIYPFISGKTVREIIFSGTENIIKKFAKFTVYLHQKGIFFRDFNTQNIIYQKNKSFALIDIQSVKIRTKPLSTKLCAKGLLRMFNNNEDKLIFRSYGIKRFMKEYLQYSYLNNREQEKLVNYIETAIDQKHPKPASQKSNIASKLPSKVV